MRPDGTKARFDAAAIAPVFETVTRPELGTFVGDQMLGLVSAVRDGSPQKGSHLDATGFFLEEGRAHRAAGIVIDGNRDPPTKWPTPW